MAVFLMIRQNGTTISMDAYESTTVLELKKMIQGIMRRAPEDIRLFKVKTKEKCSFFDVPILEQSEPLEDNKTLGESGLPSSTATAQTPATIGMAIRIPVIFDSGKSEDLRITPVSTPPDLSVMRTPQESGSSQGTEQVQS